VVEKIETKTPAATMRYAGKYIQSSGDFKGELLSAKKIQLSLCIIYSFINM